MATDLGMDPSDPLNLLLDENKHSDDWSAGLWEGTEQNKPYPDIMDFAELSSLPMDMDFNPEMGLFNPMDFAFDDPAAYPMLAPPFAFTFQPAMNNNAGSSSSGSSYTSSTPSLSPPVSPNNERRLSNASSVVYSPLTESSASSPFTSSDVSSPPTVSVKVEQQQHTSADPATEIAERARQSAGIMYALDPSKQVLANTMAMAASSHINIPRAPRPAPRSPISSSSSAASTPPPSTPPSIPTAVSKSPSSSSTISSTLSESTPAVPSTARPKTSHTTIERRYRTNLNARIQSLRMAVPALRVLEDRDGGNGKKIKKNLKDGIYVKGAGIGIDAEDGSGIDVIDERGFVDGVKVARKCSKANVLGKAVEYIRVLKRREIRLKAEQNGLKALVCGLVGGPALLKEWETRWRERFGGEEKDEVEGEDALDDDDSDEDDGEDDEEGAGRKRKRAKAAAPAKKSAERKPAATSTLVQLPPDLAAGLNGAPVPEKRKRGRPRKVVPPPMPVATLAPHISQQQVAAMQQQQQQQHQAILTPESQLHQHQHQQQQQQVPQYMLAVFALFSFFNSPLTPSYTGSSSAHSHTHNGMVLSPPPLALAPEIVSQILRTPESSQGATAAAVGAVNWAWRDALHAVHLVVSVLVLGVFLCNWLGLSFTAKKVEEKDSSKAQSSMTSAERAAQACNELVLNDDATHAPSPLALARIYFGLCHSQSTSHLISLALLLFTTPLPAPLHLIARLKASALWSQAKVQSDRLHTPRGPAPTTPLERLVVDEIGSVEDAANLLRDTDGKQRSTPVQSLASALVKQRMRKQLGALFVECVSRAQDDVVFITPNLASKESNPDDDATGKESDDTSDVEMRRTIEAATEIGGDVEGLGRLMERVWKATAVPDDLALLRCGSAFVEDSEDEESLSSMLLGNSIDAELRAQLTALVFYRTLFAGSSTPTVASLLISPPPSPTSSCTPVLGGASKSRKEKEQRDAAMMLRLRKALGNRVFEDGEGGMEDARDKVVDLIVDTERREKGRSATPST